MFGAWGRWCHWKGGLWSMSTSRLLNLKPLEALDGAVRPGTLVPARSVQRPWEVAAGNQCPSPPAEASVIRGKRGVHCSVLKAYPPMRRYPKKLSNFDMVHPSFSTLRSERLIHIHLIFWGLPTPHFRPRHPPTPPPFLHLRAYFATFF